MIIRPKDWSPEIVPWVDLASEDLNSLAEELMRFHSEFHDCLFRVEQHRLGLCYLQGLLSNLERKSAEPIALASLGPAGVRALQNFMTSYRWYENKMLAKIQHFTASAIASPDGMITTDGCDFPKKGKESVGVARQYCGPLGKVDNCQSGVFVGYSSSKGYALIHRQLYIPHSWFTEEQQERRQKCQVPEDLTFMTKPEIAGKLIQEVMDTGLFPAKWLGCDAVFGSNQDFLASLPENLWYFASVRSNTKIWQQRPQVAIPTYSGIGRPPLKKLRLLPQEPEAISLAELASHPDCDWKLVVLAEGAKGPIQAHVALMRVIECHHDLPGKESWLFMRRNADGQIKFAFSNAPTDTPLEEFIQASTMRWPIEQCFETGKSHLGMDHYETRSWPAWHRHMTYVMLAFLFLLRLHFLWEKKLQC
jgi:SRSO17 transposase